MTEEELVLVHVADRIATLTLNRPSKLNALSMPLRIALIEALQRAEDDAAVRVVIITGAGAKAFVAGADIAEFDNRTPVDQHRVMSRTGVYDVLEKYRKPVVAAINGFCLGGGMELALACDIRVAAASARFGQPEVSLGIIPGGGGTQRLPRLVGQGAALRLILTGEIVDAVEALRLGIVEEVVPDESLMPRAMAIAAMVASRSPVAVSAAKEATRAALNLPLADGLKLERALFQLCFSSEDKQEGVRAFMEKRTAQFPGR